LINAGDEVGP